MDDLFIVVHQKNKLDSTNLSIKVDGFLVNFKNQL